MANKIAIVIASADFNTSRGLVFMPPKPGRSVKWIELNIVRTALRHRYD